MCLGDGLYSLSPNYEEECLTTCYSMTKKIINCLLCKSRLPRACVDVVYSLPIVSSCQFHCFTCFKTVLLSHPVFPISVHNSSPSFAVISFTMLSGLNDKMHAQSPPHLFHRIHKFFYGVHTQSAPVAAEGSYRGCSPDLSNAPLWCICPLHFEGQETLPVFYQDFLVSQCGISSQHG